MGGLILEVNDNPLTEEEILRQRSKGIADRFPNTVWDEYVVVVGQFIKNTDPPFLHEEQLEEIRSLFWPPAENVQMPYQIEYTYLNAYRFEGHQILSGELVPLVVENIDARISIFAEYEGTVDSLPPTGSDVVGVLRPVLEGKRLELTASLCPTYHPIEPPQVIDLLACINEGECR